jgi:hypothetical protein
MTQSLTERYDGRIAGVLSCYDRVVITGTVPVICYAEGMTRYLHANGIGIFDYPRFALELRDRIRGRAASLAAEAGVTIEHIAKNHIRKEAVVSQVLAQRGEHPGLVHIISAMEACDSYQPWHDKATGRNFVRPSSGKCLHYYFYFMDADLGLIYLRVPTWSPFRLQFYGNGHSRLARQLTAEGIGFTLADNAFLRIDDWQRAQDLADGFSPDLLHRVLDRYAEQCCPVSDVFGQSYHWSLMQVEYATDLAFRSAATLGPLYEQLVRQSVLSVKAEHIATFLGRQITPQLAQEVGSQFSTRIEGTCVKHRFGKSSIKMYDKAGIVLRIETTANDVSFFKHHRKVEHRDGPPTRVKSCLAAIAAIWRICRRWMTSRGVSVRLTGSPGRARSETRPSRGSTSSRRAIMRCCMPCKTRRSLSPASAGATCYPTSAYSLRPSCPGSCAGCWILV